MHILILQEPPGDMFTGPGVLAMIGAPGSGITLPESVGEK